MSIIWTAARLRHGIRMLSVGLMLLVNACSTTQGGYSGNGSQCMCECDPARGSYSVPVMIDGQRSECVCQCDRTRGRYSYWTSTGNTSGNSWPKSTHSYRGGAPESSAPASSAYRGQQPALPPVVSSRYPSGAPSISRSSANFDDNNYEKVRREAILSAKRRAKLRKGKTSHPAAKETQLASAKKSNKGNKPYKVGAKWYYPDADSKNSEKPKKKTASKNSSKKYKVLGKWYYPLDTAEGYSEVGMASWYGKRFQGAPTASGEKFDMNKLTAAHRTLPFNSKVKVTNIETGSNVIVRINDRGPFSEDRLIDVSAAAADRLGFGGKGMIKVKVEAVE